MSQFVPSTVVAIFRNGTIPATEDDWGYPGAVDAPTVDLADARDLPALLTEMGQRTRQAAEGSSVVVHLYRLRLRPGAIAAPLIEQDRVLDQRTGVYYLVDAVPQPVNLVQQDDLRLVLRRVS